MTSSCWQTGDTATARHGRRPQQAGRDIDAQRLRDDPIVAAAVERLLGRLDGLAVDGNSHLAGALLGRAPAEYRESFDLAARAGALETAMAERLKPSVGMRNVIVHE